MISDNVECVLISPCLELTKTAPYELSTCDETVDRVIEGVTGDFNLINCRCAVNSKMSHGDGREITFPRFWFFRNN